MILDRFNDISITRPAKWLTQIQVTYLSNASVPHLKQCQKLKHFISEKRPHYYTNNVNQVISWKKNNLVPVKKEIWRCDPYNPLNFQ